MDTQKLDSPIIVVTFCVLISFVLIFTLWRMGYILSINNIIISLLIITVAIVAYIRLFIFLKEVESEEKLINKYNESAPKELKDVALTIEDFPESLIKNRVNHFLQLSRLNADINENQISKLTENQFRISGNIIRYLASSLIFIGLLGTFLGIAQSAEGFGDIIDSFDKKERIESNNFSPILNGLDRALGTSILGILLSLIINLAFLLAKNFQYSVINKLESITITSIVPHFKKGKRQHEIDIITDSIMKNLSKRLLDSFKLMSQSLEHSSKRVIAASDKLFESVEGTSSMIGDAKLIAQNISDSSTTLKNASVFMLNNMSDFKKSLDLLAQSKDNLAEEIQTNRNLFLQIDRYIETQKDSIEASILEVSTSIKKELGDLLNSMEKLMTNQSESFNRLNLIISNLETNFSTQVSSHEQSLALLQKSENDLREELKSNRKAFGEIDKNLVLQQQFYRSIISESSQTIKSELMLMNESVNDFLNSQNSNSDKYVLEVSKFNNNFESQLKKHSSILTEQVEKLEVIIDGINNNVTSKRKWYKNIFNNG